MEREVLAFQPLMLFFVRVHFPTCLLNWRANNYLSRRVEGIKWGNRITRTQLVLILTIVISQFSFFPTTILVTVIELSSFKKNSVLIAVLFFP